MQVLVIGSTRGTGRLLVDRLVADGHEVRAMIRDPRAGRRPPRCRSGARPRRPRGRPRGRDAGRRRVAFCAGSGSSTGPDATLRVDLLGAIRTVDLAEELGIGRYVMLSSMAADDPLRGSEAIRHYLAAKHAADRILLASGLDATIVRPGGLTHDEPTGRVEVGVPRLERRGTIPRADVAAVMARCLDDPASIGATFELLSGDTPIDEAVAGLAADRAGCRRPAPRLRARGRTDCGGRPDGRGRGGRRTVRLAVAGGCGGRSDARRPGPSGRTSGAGATHGRRTAESAGTRHRPRALPREGAVPAEPARPGGGRLPRHRRRRRRAPAGHGPARR
jgi:uncharacterized protein YbjT (DUF2867 family)